MIKCWLTDRNENGVITLSHATPLTILLPATKIKHSHFRVIVFYYIEMYCPFISIWNHILVGSCESGAWYPGGGWPPVGRQDVLLLPGPRQPLPYHGVPTRRYLHYILCISMISSYLINYIDTIELLIRISSRIYSIRYLFLHSSNQLIRYQDWSN